MRYLRLSGLVMIVALLAACNQDPVVAPQDDAQEVRRGTNAPGTIADNHLAEFEVTIYNLTPATQPGASQPLSPPVVATHTPLFRIWRLGSFASEELAQVAEDAVSGPLVESLQNSDFVHEVKTGSGVILPGQSATVNITANTLYRKISVVSMLVNTNDAFAGANSVRLPLFGSKTVYLNAYDAGSEANTESIEHIPGPCCGNPLVRVPTHERIIHHAGILGVGDLDPAVYGWDGAVAKMVITRIN